MSTRCRRRTQRHLAALTLLGSCLLPALAATADDLPLPAAGPAAGPQRALCLVAGCAADRLLTSVAPGPVSNQEQVQVDLAGDGDPQQVVVEQRLHLTGRGDYQIRERGPARSARSLSDLDPPITKFGAVVWQGFSPASTDLAASLLLDPALERSRLPLTLTAGFVPAAGGASRALGPGGVVPGAGTVTVTLHNQTGQPALLPTALDAPAAVTAPLLDALRRVAQAPAGPALPVAGGPATGGLLLPASVPVTGPAEVAGQSRVPLRITGTVQVAGAPASVRGPGTTATSRGATIAGTLSGDATLTTVCTGPAVLQLALQVAPVLDARALAPPAGAASWARWAATGPARPARAAALDVLVAAAAAGARAASFSPYLATDLPGPTGTSFTFTFAAAPLPTRAAGTGPAVRPAGVALTAVALSLLLANAALLWRRG